MGAIAHHAEVKMSEHDNRKFPRPSQLAHTFSIVARDPESGEMGAAVQSHWFSVGSLVTWAEAGVGAVATQALVEVSYGPLGLALMRAGKSAPEALATLLAADEGRDMRQVAMVDAQGRASAHTGARCIVDAGHETGEGFSVQANMMACPDVWPTMARAYREAEGDLAEHLLVALEAGQAAGGDVRGQQSVAILIVKPVSAGQPWTGTVMELRVEDHPEPIRELRRLVHLHQAYQRMNHGDELMGAGQTEEALQEYRTAAEMAPEIEEMGFWHAVTLADLGRVDEALPLFREVFAKNAGWPTLITRLPQAGLLRDDPEMMHRILALAS
ncbi:MAG: Zn-dependent protease [Chloroflexi bacterium]|nr:MAG: Zn-dependent protease [Chloroflexota bacterium]RLC79016.1 MAG: Zn-dependent protease [Chloroflexota bacterium]